MFGDIFPMTDKNTFIKSFFVIYVELFIYISMRFNRHNNQSNLFPVFQLDDRFPETTKNGNQLPDDMIISIKEILRQNVDNVDVDPLTQVINSIVCSSETSR